MTNSSSKQVEPAPDECCCIFVGVQPFCGHCGKPYTRVPVDSVAPRVDERIIEIVAATSQSSLWNASGYHQALVDTLNKLRSLGVNRTPPIGDSLRTLLESYAEPCVGDCDHSQCPLLRELHALRIKATLERARLTVKPIVDKERKGEEIGDLMNMRLDTAAASPAPKEEAIDAERLAASIVALWRTENSNDQTLVRYIKQTLLGVRSSTTPPAPVVSDRDPDD